MDRRRIPASSEGVLCLPTRRSWTICAIKRCEKNDQKKLTKLMDQLLQLPSRESRKWQRSLQSTFLLYLSHEENASNTPMP